MTSKATLTRRHSAALGGLVNDKPIALRLERKELDEAHSLAKAEGRSASNFGRLIYLMGMAEYKRLGRIALPGSAAPAQAAD